MALDRILRSAEAHRAMTMARRSSPKIIPNGTAIEEQLLSYAADADTALMSTELVLSTAD
jgi:hypothetical protein